MTTLGSVSEETAERTEADQFIGVLKTEEECRVGPESRLLSVLEIYLQDWREL